ncbi:hypothetical protein FIU83_06415 [Halomonas sp. THAF5a]|uniref:head-tail connector protein n=1 Tax=Halomonas sp. THAF5a TaxID=2587844 RepID=UPI0012695C8D|nr:hypothetical protein [Halomonas sp. THAF5a]QFU01269.1 hypothetical protein FIU83_06415 [Halomonas sp. THAF5a]
MVVRTRLVTAPSVEPVSVAEAKEQSLVEHAEHDGMFERLIAAARQEAEQRTGRALITQAWQQRQPADGNTVCLRRWPLLAVTSVSDDQGTLDPTDYRVEIGDFPAVIANRSLTGTVTVAFTAGYGEAAADVPSAIRQWILVTVASLYEHREKAVTGTITSEHRFIDGLLDHYVVTPT